MAQLLYRVTPEVDFRRLRENVERHCGGVDPASICGGKHNQAHFFMDEGMVEFKDGRSKSQLCLLASAPVLDRSRLDLSLSQTWNWSEAKADVDRCSSALVAVDFAAAPLGAQTRSKLFLGFVRAVLETVPAEAVHFMNSQIVVDPNRFLREQDGSVSDRMQSAINVRLFRIEGGECECLMDTMGLGVLGLPDIQCHFRDLDCRAVANKLYGVAVHLFQNGDVVQDGETIPGLEVGENWCCQHEMALVGPERVVLDLNPGSPHAAGGRYWEKRARHTVWHAARAMRLNIGVRISRGKPRSSVMEPCLPRSSAPGTSR